MRGKRPGRSGIRRGALRRTAGSLALAVLAGLLGAYPAAADDTVDDTVVPISRSFRQQAVDLWASGGTEVRSAAEAALVGSPDDIAAFLANYGDQELQDYRIEAAQLAAMGGDNTLDAVRTALAGSEGDLVAFMKSGYQEPLEQDQRVLLARAIDAGGPEVQERGRTALAGTAEDLQIFLDTGLTEAQEQDDRVLLTTRPTATCFPGGPPSRRA
ncbi:ALF repeat-containing protein [Streptomyces sp. NPDC002088]|uniref:ALF repeat-containing protein n=1 Tax=Streptomyces sp. NPDC002088 TaxID=3154665 RepID=UPI00332F8ACB